MVLFATRKGAIRLCWLALLPPIWLASAARSEELRDPPVATGVGVADIDESPCGAMGDYIFNQVDWTNTANYRIDIPERVAGGFLHAPKNDRIRDGKGPYPVGPYWIHSHLHTLAKSSVLAGQSAFLSVDCAR